MEKKQKKLPLIVPILWFIAAALWTVNFALRLTSPYPATESTLVLTLLAGLGAYAAAFVNLWRYKRDKKAAE